MNSEPTLLVLDDGAVFPVRRFERVEVVPWGTRVRKGVGRVLHGVFECLVLLVEVVKFVLALIVAPLTACGIVGAYAGLVALLLMVWGAIAWCVWQVVEWLR